MEGSVKAFDINIRSRSYSPDDQDDVGWCFGLPRGITAEQWPLDPDNAYPLMHAFTIKVPEENRRHRPDQYAFALFGTSFDMNQNGGPEIIDLMKGTMAGNDPTSDDPILQAVWMHEQRRHERLIRLKDGMGCNYALIFLNSGEFYGPSCFPPDIPRHRSQFDLAPPRWLTEGTAAAVFASGQFKNCQKIFGGRPGHNLDYNRSLGQRQRLDDPNAGVPSRNQEADSVRPYTSPYVWNDKDELELCQWVRDLSPNHFGGTMWPAQNVPRFSDHYFEFEQLLGGFNFGDGHCQIDLDELVIDTTRF